MHNDRQENVVEGVERALLCIALIRRLVCDLIGRTIHMQEFFIGPNLGLNERHDLLVQIAVCHLDSFYPLLFRSSSNRNSLNPEFENGIL